MRALAAGLFAAALLIPIQTSALPSIQVGSASGAPGEQVTFAVSLNTEGLAIAGVQNDIAFDSINTPIGMTPTGRPDCAVNPSINKDGTLFAFQPSGCSGSDCTGIRALVLSLSNVTPIPDGSILYICNDNISPAASWGSYPLVISNVGLSDPDGQAVAAVGTDGSIEVSGTPGTPFPTWTPAPTPTPVPPPPNDDFANATVIDALPFTDAMNTMYATREPGEPTASCDYGPLTGTVWYAFTPSQSESISVSANGIYFPAMVAAYTGSSLTSLTELGCQMFGSLLTFEAGAGTSYYFQVAGLFDSSGPVQFQLTLPPPPVAGFSFYPSDPSVFDTIQFYDNSYDPAGVEFESLTWDFGDGATATGGSPTHQYAADGDYTVQHSVTTFDGRTASISQMVQVRTHDVAITKFSAPNAAKAGQTRSISVGVNSKRYLEDVQVDLYKGTPGTCYPSGCFQLVGSLRQSVPVRPSNRTTDFSILYTFTHDDAALGKVTFKANATIIGARDSLSADNEAISAPTKVNR